MVLKQCHTRLKVVVFNHTEKWYDPTHNKHRVSSLVPAPPSSLTAVCSSVITAPCTKFDKPTWRRRRAPGPKTMHVTAGRHMSIRGNTLLLVTAVFNGLIQCTYDMAPNHYFKLSQTLLKVNLVEWFSKWGPGNPIGPWGASRKSPAAKKGIICVLYHFIES